MPQTTAPTPNQPGKWVVSEFGVPSVLKWETFDPLPAPPRDEVLIRIVTAGISGADNIQRAGGYPDRRCQTPGFTPGYDFVGRVEAIGPLGPAMPEGSGLAVGDLVTSICVVGAYATHIILPVSEVIKLRPNDDPVKMVAIPLNYMTAYGMLKRTEAKLPPGSSILIGSVSGGVGTAMAQLVKAFDMKITMFGTCSASKFDFVKSLGVTPIDRNDPNMSAKVRELTGGKGVDAAYDAVGSKESYTNSLQATKDTGVVIAIGIMAGIAPDGSGLVDTGFDAFQFAADRPRISWFAVTHQYYYKIKDTFLQDIELVFQAVRDGKLEPSIGKVFPLRDAVKANEMLVSGAGVTGKLEFIVDAELAKSNKL